MSGQPCAWDSPTAYRFCYTHKAWRETVADVCPVAAEVEVLRAQVAAVRRLCYLSDTLRAADVLDALDGGSDE